jgi:septal ring factor EnvC (AmiA/AmiB activator)
MLLNKKLKVEVEEQASLVAKLDSRIRDARDEKKKLRQKYDVLETAFKVVKEENEINKKNILTYGLGKSE